MCVLRPPTERIESQSKIAVHIYSSCSQSRATGATTIGWRFRKRKDRRVLARTCLSNLFRPRHSPFIQFCVNTIHLTSNIVKRFVKTIWPPHPLPQEMCIAFYGFIFSTVVTVSYDRAQNKTSKQQHTLTAWKHICVYCFDNICEWINYSN